MTSPLETGHRRWLPVTDTFDYELARRTDGTALDVERDVLAVFLRDDRVVDVTTDLQPGADALAGRLVVEVEAGVYLDGSDDDTETARRLRDDMRLQAAAALDEVDALVSMH